LPNGCKKKSDFASVCSGGPNNSDTKKSEFLWGDYKTHLFLMQCKVEKAKIAEHIKLKAISITIMVRKILYVYKNQKMSLD